MNEYALWRTTMGGLRTFQPFAVISFDYFMKYCGFLSKLNAQCF